MKLTCTLHARIYTFCKRAHTSIQQQFLSDTLSEPTACISLIRSRFFIGRRCSFEAVIQVEALTI